MSDPHMAIRAPEFAETPGMINMVHATVLLVLGEIAHMAHVTYKRRGGLHFLSVGRLRLQWSIAATRKH